MDCFNISLCGIHVGNGRAEITQGLEQLTVASARCFCHAFYYLTATGSTSSILEDICQCYHSVFPNGTDFTGLPSCHIMIMVDALIRRNWSPHPIWHKNIRPSDHEYTLFAQDIARLAQVECQQKLYVPNWILDFAFNSLSLNPLPPPSVVVDCLKIIAINLGCDVSIIVTLDNRYLYLSLIHIHILTKSSDKVEGVLTLIIQQLRIMVEHGGQFIDSTLVVDCYKIFVCAIDLSNRRAAVTQELEQLATVSAGCFYCAFYRLAIVDPTSSILAKMRKQYCRDFHPQIDFRDLPFYHTMTMIGALLREDWSTYSVWHVGDRPSSHEYIQFTQDIAELACVEYQRDQRVSCWILDFAFDFLYLDPLLPAYIVANCLKIIAVDLGCDVASIIPSDERYVCFSLISIHLLMRISVQVEPVSSLIIQKVETMAEAKNLSPVVFKHKAICTLLPYAIFLEKLNQQKLADAIKKAIQALKYYFFMVPIQSYIPILFRKPSSPFRNWLITLVSPQVDWNSEGHKENMVIEWAAASLTAPHTEEIIGSVVDTLMQIASVDSLCPNIPIDIWVWMKQQSLSHVHQRQHWKTTPDTIHHIRRLGDLEITKSYLLLVWSEWSYFSADVLNEMEISIREEFDGIEMYYHRGDLINWLDCVIDKLGLVNVDSIQGAQQQYEQLKGMLLDMDWKAMKSISRKSLNLGLFQ